VSQNGQTRFSASSILKGWLRADSRRQAAKKVLEEEEMIFSRNGERGFVKALLGLVLLVLLVAAVYFFSARNSSIQNAFSSIKESTQDAATTSRVRTALLLSKNVSPFDIKVETINGEVTLEGQVPSEHVKTVAGAIAQDTASVKQVHNNLGINPAIERNPDREHLGDRVADLEIQTLVSDALSKNSDLTEKHIGTEVKNRTVTLNGTVQSTTQKYTAEQIAWQVVGVQGLTDNLSVTDPQAATESADDKLARRVEFELYSTKAIPLKTVQIHADNGVVTLTGTVLSRAEKLLAEKTAKSVEGVRRVVNSLAAPEET
jgi:hyperosmotically inducible periplasmic protein